jgi:peptidoglycan hydrolase-like protein with peptidoglycan-binding domain
MGPVILACIDDLIRSGDTGGTPPQPPILPPSTGFGEKLAIGSSGTPVVELQQRLNDAGANPPLAVDGKFGPGTQRAVIAFQRANGLQPDGVVGPKTRAKLGM